MRVLHLYKDYAPVVGGIENYIRLLAEGMRSCGIQTEVLVTNTGPSTQQEVVNGVPVTKTGRHLSISSAPVSLSFYPWLYRLGHNLDIAHAHLPYPPGELGQLLFGRSRRFVVTYHSDIVRQKVLGTLYAPILKLVLRKAHLITVSNPVYIQNSSFLESVAEKCRVIPFGVDLDRFAPTPAIQTAAAEIRTQYAGKPLILFVGRLRHYKGINVLIKAMHQIDAHALIIGSGPMGDAWRQQAQAADLNHKIHFLGAVSDEDVLASYHAADLFVLPSTNRAETLGIVQIEAMACGLPLVCTELGTGTTFVNQHDKTGLVVPPQDLHALAHAINQLLGNDALRQQMGAAGRRRAASVFAKEAMLTRMIAFYQEALQLSGP